MLLRWAMWPMNFLLLVLTLVDFNRFCEVRPHWSSPGRFAGISMTVCTQLSSFLRAFKRRTNACMYTCVNWYLLFIHWFSEHHKTLYNLCLSHSFSFFLYLYLSLSLVWKFFVLTLFLINASVAFEKEKFRSCPRYNL